MTKTKAEEKATTVPANKAMVGVIEAIHGVVNKNEVTRNYLRARLTRAQLWAEIHPIKEVLMVMSPPKGRQNNHLIYQLSFGEEDL